MLICKVLLGAIMSNIAQLNSFALFQINKTGTIVKVRNLVERVILKDISSYLQ